MTKGASKFKDRFHKKNYDRLRRGDDEYDDYDESNKYFKPVKQTPPRNPIVPPPTSDTIAATVVPVDEPGAPVKIVLGKSPGKIKILKSQIQSLLGTENKTEAEIRKKLRDIDGLQKDICNERFEYLDKAISNQLGADTPEHTPISSSPGNIPPTSEVMHFVSDSSKYGGVQGKDNGFKSDMIDCQKLYRGFLLDKMEFNEKNMSDRSILDKLRDRLLQLTKDYDSTDPPYDHRAQSHALYLYYRPTWILGKLLENENEKGPNGGIKKTMVTRRMDEAGRMRNYLSYTVKDSRIQDASTGYTLVLSGKIEMSWVIMHKMLNEKPDVLNNILLEDAQMRLRHMLQEQKYADLLIQLKDIKFDLFKESVSSEGTVVQQSHLNAGIINTDHRFDMMIYYPASYRVDILVDGEPLPAGYVEKPVSKTDGFFKYVSEDRLTHMALQKFSEHINVFHGNESLDYYRNPANLDGMRGKFPWPAYWMSFPMTVQFYSAQTIGFLQLHIGTHFVCMLVHYNRIRCSPERYAQIIARSIAVKKEIAEEKQWKYNAKFARKRVPVAPDSYHGVDLPPKGLEIKKPGGEVDRDEVEEGNYKDVSHPHHVSAPIILLNRALGWFANRVAKHGKNYKDFQFSNPYFQEILDEYKKEQKQAKAEANGKGRNKRTGDLLSQEILTKEASIRLMRAMMGLYDDFKQGSNHKVGVILGMHNGEAEADGQVFESVMAYNNTQQPKGLYTQKKKKGLWVHRKYVEDQNMREKLVKWTEFYNFCNEQRVLAQLEVDQEIKRFPTGDPYYNLKTFKETDSILAITVPSYTLLKKNGLYREYLRVFPVAQRFWQKLWKDKYLDLIKQEYSKKFLDGKVFVMDVHGKLVDSKEPVEEGKDLTFWYRDLALFPIDVEYIERKARYIPKVTNSDGTKGDHESIREIAAFALMDHIKSGEMFKPFFDQVSEEIWTNFQSYVVRLLIYRNPYISLAMFRHFVCFIMEKMIVKCGGNIGKVKRERERKFGEFYEDDDDNEEDTRKEVKVDLHKCLMGERKWLLSKIEEFNRKMKSFVMNVRYNNKGQPVGLTNRDARMPLHILDSWHKEMDTPERFMRYYMFQNRYPVTPAIFPGSAFHVNDDPEMKDDYYPVRVKKGEPPKEKYVYPPSVFPEDKLRTKDTSSAWGKSAADEKECNVIMYDGDFYAKELVAAQVVPGKGGVSNGKGGNKTGGTCKPEKKTPLEISKTNSIYLHRITENAPMRMDDVPDHLIDILEYS